MFSVCYNHDMDVGQIFKEVSKVDKFSYKKVAGITALSASLSDFKYKKHYHQEYAIGVTLRGIQHYYLDGSLQLSYPKGVMLLIQNSHMTEWLMMSRAWII